MLTSGFVFSGNSFNGLLAEKFTVALIPVDREMAKAKRWRMPLEPLYCRLMKETKGKTILSDAAIPDLGSDPALTIFRERVTETALYTDFEIFKITNRAMA